MNQITNTPQHLTNRPGEIVESPPALHERYVGTLRTGASQESMRSVLNVVARLMGESSAHSVDWVAVAHDSGALRKRVVEHYTTPSGANTAIAAIRGVLKIAWLSGDITREQYELALHGLKSVRGESLPTGRALGMGEVRALFDSCARDTTPSGARDACALALMMGAGLRRSEVAAAVLEDYDRDTGRLRVTGKGGKQRFVYAKNGGREAIDAWLDVRGDDPGPLLHPVHYGRIRFGKPITGQALRKRLVARCKDAGVKDCTPHDLRRTMITTLLDSGAEISAVAKLAGHSSIDTTTRYDMAADRRAENASDMFHIPYTRPQS